MIIGVAWDSSLAFAVAMRKFRFNDRLIRNHLTTKDVLFSGGLEGVGAVMQPRSKTTTHRSRTIGQSSSSIFFCMLLLAPRHLLAAAWSPNTYLGSNRFQKRWFNSEKAFDVSKVSLQEMELSRQPMSELRLSQRVREAYLVGETDGILDLALSVSIDSMPPDDLVAASIEAGMQNKRQFAGILNAWIGSCCLLDNTDVGAGLAWELLGKFDDVSDSIQIYPDVLSLSLVYSALCRANQDSYSVLADTVLERAMKLSKKTGGSKRRRALAASRRQGKGVTAKEVEKDLQALCGSDFHVLHETDDLVVVSKPSGMVCFHKHKTTAGKITSARLKKNKKQVKGRRDIDISLEDALLHFKVPLSTLNHEGRGLVHRIDRGTSGCIVLAKTDDMHAKLVSEFFLRRAKKDYCALVSSSDNIPTEGVLDTPVNGRPAKSRFRVTNRYGNVAACLRIETTTGRKHQVRVHCAKELGSPILMDPRYGTEGAENVLPHEVVDKLQTESQQRFFLHASSLQIPKYDVQVEAPLPGWWEDSVTAIEKEQSDAV